MTGSRTDLDVAGRALSISNLDKVLWPETGTTKGELVDYYAAVGEVMVPHLAGRPITMRRWPDGVDARTFFQKHAPKYRPGWMATVELGGVDYLRIDEPAGLVWAAGQASIEIHPGLATADDLNRPTFVVFDLDPGPPADISTCVEVATILRSMLPGLEMWPKTSGRKGLQLYLPLGGTATFEETHRFAHDLATRAEAEHPDLIVSVIERKQRRSKVLIDWSQNAPSRTTVGVYSVRAVNEPRVSMPVQWEELEDPSSLRFNLREALERIDHLGDLMSPVLTERQTLP